MVKLPSLIASTALILITTGGVAEETADQIADQAVRAGAKYVVLTTRHHDGYCLFDTATQDFHAVKTGPGRDLVAEFADA